MFILNETNYSDGKATFYDNAGTVVEGGTLKIFSPDYSVAEYAIDHTGAASFSIERMILYRFEIYSADGELVSVLDPVMYESVESSGQEGGESVEDYGERIGDLERTLNREADARKRSDDGIRSSIADVNADVAGLRAGLENEANIRSTHEQRTDNPHQVTAHQVGAYTQQETDSKVSEEAETRAAADEDLAQQIEDSRVDVDENLDPESTNPVENRAVTEAMGGKQDQLIEMTDEEVNELVNSL